MKTTDRTRKLKILQDALQGRTAPLYQFHHQLRCRDYSLLTDEELEAEYERLRWLENEETGILPPPMPDFASMTDEQLSAYRDERYLDKL